MDEGENVEFDDHTIILTPVDFNSGRVYASQDWVYGKPSRGLPSVYPFYHKGERKYLIGDGHKRIADSILNNDQILCKLDTNLGEVDSETLRTPLKAQIKYARYGIEGFFPFKKFIKKFKKQATVPD